MAGMGGLDFMKPNNELIDTQVCAGCGLSRDEHCIFTPRRAPTDCKCDYAAWSVTTISPICDNYEDEGFSDSRCKNCEHEKGCHQP